MLQAWTKTLVLLAAALAGTKTFSQQDSAKPVTCTVSGQVVRDDNGAAIQRAHVVLKAYSAPQRTYSTLSDEVGKFSIAGIEPGRYELFAQKNGYLLYEFGRREARYRGAVLNLPTGRVMDDMVLRMMGAAVIAGKVLDEDGEPVSGAQVQALFELHRNRYYSIFFEEPDFTPAGAVTTNDFGEFRLIGLYPGEYLVRSSDPDFSGINSLLGKGANLATFYPATTSMADAVPVALAAGQEVHIDIQLRSSNATARIRGKIVPPSGHSPNEVSILLDADNNLPLMPGYSVSIDENGTFEISSVASGAYTLRAALNDRGRRYSAVLPLTIGDRDIDDVRVVVAPEKQLRGRISILSGSLAAQEKPPLRVMFGTRNGFSNLTAVAADGTFTVELEPRTYAVKVFGAPENFYIKSAHYGLQDVLQNGLALGAGTPPGVLEIVMGTSAATLEGTITDKEGGPETLGLLLVPDQPNLFKAYAFKQGATDSLGKFRFTGLAPGAYKLVAIKDEDEKLVVDVTASEGETKSLSLKVESGSASDGGR